MKQPRNQEKIRWRVSHPAHGTAEVEAVDRLRAITGAAGMWRVPWTTIARECAAEKVMEEDGKTRL